MRLRFQPPGGIQLNLLLVHWMVPPQWDHANLQAPYWRLYWNPCPGMFVSSDNREIPLLPAHFILIPPETPFASRMDRSGMHFYVHFLTAPQWGQRQIEIVPVPARQHEILNIWIQSTPDAAGPWTIAALISECLEKLPASGWVLERPFSGRIQAAMEMVESRLPRPISVRELARLAGMNLNAFIRSFREQSGQTPAAFILDRRLDAACLLLHHTEDSIERIAAACGFCDRYHFSRAFSRSRGIAPAAFRRQARQRG